MTSCYYLSRYWFEYLFLFLFQATKNPFYLHVGKEILTSLNQFTKVECGYATIHDVETKTLEDRQESFFLSETCKYLYLLFDTDNHINKNADQYLFTTEGHVFPLKHEFRHKAWDENDFSDFIFKTAFESQAKNESNECILNSESDEVLPIQSDYLAQIFQQIGAQFS